MRHNNDAREPSCEEQMEKLRHSFKAVNNSRNKYMVMCIQMRSLITEMVLQTKGWMYDDLDLKASELINNFNDMRDGLQ